MNLSFPNIILICWLFTGVTVHAQVIKGQITDANSRPVSNASLFIKELKQGTTTNNEGYYELKVAEGAYTCVFQCLGYETETRKIAVGAGTNIHNITLHEKAYQIKEVVITDDKEDPAYGIMRRAIAMAPYYMNQVSEYKAEAYLKGSFQSSSKTKDNTSVEESFNEIEFVAPNKYRQKILKKTGKLPYSNSNNSDSVLFHITPSVYSPTAFGPIISPLSSSAFSHYRFRYEGFVNEDDRIINKIKIIPARKSKQLMSGYIYIADNFWNVHNVDISFDLVVSELFINKNRMQINFGEISNNVWMPVSHRMNVEASLFGDKASLHYLSSVKYNRIVENTSMHKPDALLLAEQQRKAMQQSKNQPLALKEEESKQKSKNIAKFEKIMEKDNLTNRDAYDLMRLMQKVADAEKNKNKSAELLYVDYKVTVDSAANQHDTTYWEMMRPVPLSSDELKSYREKEIKSANASQQLTDNVQNIPNVKKKSPFIRTTKKILSGTNFKLGNNGGTLQYHGLMSSKCGFNTVDGFYIGQKLTYYKDFTNTARENRLTITPEAVWGINRKAVMWNVDASLTYAPMQRGMAQIRLGKITDDFSNAQSIFPLENTVSSLFFRRNYLKLYEHHFIEANNTIDIVNGLQLTATLKYARRVMLNNTSDYSFKYRDSREYTPNIPINAELDANATLPDHTSATFMLRLDYTPRFYYRIDRYSRKQMVKSDFPTFSGTWQKGVNGLLGSDSNFDHLSIGVQQKIGTGSMQEFRYMLRGGTFVNRKSVFFPDFRHFNTVQIPVTIGSMMQHSFNLLEYYRYSTSNNYLEAHLYYETPLLLLKFLPFFNKRWWQEGLQLNYLYTSKIKNYMELGYTIGSKWRAGVFAGFEDFKYRSFGVKLSFPIRLIR